MGRDFGLTPTAQKIAEYVCVRYYRYGDSEFDEFEKFGVTGENIIEICNEFEASGLAYVTYDDYGKPYLSFWEQIAEFIDSPLLRRIRH